MAAQNSGTVSITGGAIDGTTIGGNSAAVGTFSSVTDNGLTAGRVTFAGASGLLSDNANLFWDNANGRLGIGNGAPTTTLDVTGDITGSDHLFVNGVGDGVITLANGGLKSGTLNTTGGSVTLYEGPYAGASTGATTILGAQGDADLDGSLAYATATAPTLNVGEGTNGGAIAMYDPSGTGFRGIITTSPLTADRMIQIPDVTGQFLAVTSQSSYTDFVALQPGGVTPTAQTMANLPGSVGMYINTPPGGGDLMRLQVNAIDAFTVGNTGQVTVTQGNLQVSNAAGGSLFSFDGNVGQTGLDVEDIAGSSVFNSGDIGLAVGATSHPDIASHFGGLSTDLELSGFSYTDIPGTSIHGPALVMNGSNGDPLGTPGDVPALLESSGTYESGADLAGKSTSTTSYGLRTAGNNTSTDGNSNSALWVKSGEINVARQATDAASNAGTNLITEDDATAADKGPSGVVDLTVGAEGANELTTQTLDVHNIYVNSSSIILLTIMNTDDGNFDASKESATATVENRGTGVFTIRVSRNGSNNAPANGAWDARVGFMVINAAK